MTKNPGQLFRNDTSQRERTEVLRNDRRASTYLDHTHDDEGGRFSKPRQVIGVDAIEYPRLPENSWTNDPVPNEPSLGHAIDAQEPVGEVGEIEASLGAATAAPSVADLGDATTQAPSGSQPELASPNHLADLARDSDTSVTPISAGGASSALDASPSVSSALAISKPKPKLRVRGI
jgi:hypothetical protein